MNCLVELYLERIQNRKTKGKELRAYRRKLKLTPQNMVEMLNISKEIIRDIEVGVWIERFSYYQNLLMDRLKIHNLDVVNSRLHQLKYPGYIELFVPPDVEINIKQILDDETVREFHKLFNKDGGPDTEVVSAFTPSGTFSLETYSGKGSS